MNQKLASRLIEIARAMKPNLVSGKSWHITAIIKQGKIICVGWNNYNRLHPAHIFGEYKNYKGFTDKFRPGLHSEISALIKMGQEDLTGHILVNLRINNNNAVALSKPCPNCEKILRSLLIKRVYYSTNTGEFEELV